MGAKIQAFDIFQTPLSSHYPLPTFKDIVKQARKERGADTGTSYLSFEPPRLQLLRSKQEDRNP